MDVRGSLYRPMPPAPLTHAGSSPGAINTARASVALPPPPATPGGTMRRMAGSQRGNLPAPPPPIAPGRASYLGTPISGSSPSLNPSPPSSENASSGEEDSGQPSPTKQDSPPTRPAIPIHGPQKGTSHDGFMSPEAEKKAETKQSKVYQLSKPSDEELEVIHQFLEKRPEFHQRYTIKSIEKVNSRIRETLFKAKLEELGLKADNAVLNGTWNTEQEPETRRDVHADLEAMKTPTEQKNVFTAMAFHATKEDILDPVLTSGLDFLGKTDKGYFGRGIYFTTHPEYAARVYSKHDHLVLICEVGFRNLFPVASCDELMGSAIRPGFDGHFAHVVPKTESENEVMYVSRGAFGKKKYDELIMHDSSQILIKYVMRLTPKNVQPVKKHNGKELSDLILKYLNQNPQFDDQHDPLNKKLDELSRNPEKALEPGDSELFDILTRSLAERDDKIKVSLGERVKNNLVKKEVVKEAEKALPAGLKKAQETELQDNSDIFKAESYIKEGKGLKEEKAHEKFLKAVNLYTEVVKRSPTSFDANFGCGSANFLLGRVDAAITYFYAAREIGADKDRIAEVKAALVKALAKRAAIYAQADEFDKALKDLNEAIELDPRDITVLGQFASIYFAKEEFERAIAYCGRALSVNPKCAAALRVRGAIYLNMGKERHAQGLEDLKQAIAMNPQTFSLITRARFFLSNNQLEGAEKDCKTLLEKDPKDRKNLEARLGGLWIRATLHLKRNDPASAEKDLQACEKIMRENKMGKDHWLIACLYGDVYLQKNDLKKAKEAYTRGITACQKEKVKQKDKPMLYQFLLNRGKTHDLLKQTDLAISDCTEAIQLDPNNAAAFDQRCSLYKRKNETRLADADEAAAHRIRATEKKG